MGLLSKILGTGDIVSKGFDLIDSMHTSDTELIEAKSIAKTRLMESYAPFKVAQRYLALMFGGTYLFSFGLVLVLTLTGSVADVGSVNEVLSQFYVGEIMLTIIVFYFGGGFAEGALKAKKDSK